MHVVGVPVATGYKRGLSKQVAKTKVFDQERLEKIQDGRYRYNYKQLLQRKNLDISEWINFQHNVLIWKKIVEGKRICYYK